MEHDNFKTGWEQGPGVCGAGSEDQWINLDANEFIKLISLSDKRHPVVNEAGCGDLFWLRNHYKFFECYMDYCGYELQPRQVHTNCQGLDFVANFDITKQVMRPCDLVLSRLVFIHLPNKMISDALNRFRMAGAKELIASHWHLPNNDNRHTSPSYVGKPYDLSKPPFNLVIAARAERNALFVL